MALNVITQKFIYRTDIKANPKSLYLFGDNLCRVGFGGQAAEMRGEPNSFGIATKITPGHSEGDYFSDAPSWFDVIDREFAVLKGTLVTFPLVNWGYGKKYMYETVIIPSDGLGTGLSKLPEKAPKLLDYINQHLSQIKEY